MQKKLIEGNRRPFSTSIACIADTYTDSTLLEQDAVKTPYELFFSSPQHFETEKEFDKEGNQVMFYD